MNKNNYKVKSFKHRVKLKFIKLFNGISFCSFFFGKFIYLSLLNVGATFVKNKPKQINKKDK